MASGGDGNDTTGTGRPAACAADLRAGIEQFAQAVETMTGAWDLLDDDARHDAYVAIEKARRRLAIVDAEYLSAAANGRVVKPTPKVVEKLTVNAHVSRAEARRRISAAHRLQRPEAQNRPPEHDLPAVRRKVAEGVVGADAVEIIDKALDGLPKKAEKLIHVADPHIADLLDKVRVDDLKHLGPMLRALLGLDDPYTDEDRQRRRSLRLSTPDSDNMSRISGHITPEFAAILRRLFADHAGPGGLLPDGAEETRSADQRRHDAAEAAVAAGYGAPDSDDGGGDDGVDGADTGTADGPGDDPGDAPGEGGCGVASPGRPPEDPPPAAPDLRPAGRLRPKRGTTSIVVTMHISELAAMTGTALTDVSTSMSIGEAIRGADAHNVFLSVMDFKGQNLWFGRARRCGSMAQYLALCAEEGMSTAPGSSSPAAYCDIHHIDRWDTGGLTDIGGLTLADYVMHGRVDDDRTDENRWWTTRAGTSSSQGPGPRPPGHERGHERGPEPPTAGPDNPKVRWIPPRSEDPARTPRENHHPLGWLAPGRRIRRYFARRSGEGGAGGDRGDGGDGGDK
ncbi:DUF222 domain-containing protein [Corynebacterium sp. NPDC060344]|uniref:DUF222 domain-containing protein n=1 Tax=Corynebacterium sp. NPDC060344 TaxID=3347101 RepID=UPI003648C90C